MDSDQAQQNVRSIMIILEYYLFRRLLITFANSLDQDQAQQNVRLGPKIRRAWYGSKPFDNRQCSPEFFLEKDDFEVKKKNNQQTTKSMERIITT